jgi:TRAP-type C4-dicarboxylate transport system permease small subunit
VIVERVCIALMAVLVADVFLGVWSRYVMRATFQWYDEVARLCFVWMIFLGAALAVRRGGHFRLHLVIDRLSATARRRVDIIVTLIVIAFAAVLLAGGIAIAPLARRQVTDSLEISMLWFYGALPVGGALMIVFALPQLWALMRSSRER